MVATKVIDYIGAARAIVFITVTLVGLVVYAAEMRFRVNAHGDTIAELKASMRDLEHTMSILDTNQKLLIQKIDILLERSK